ncbi:hypothetical protein C8R47DRAFT_1325203 [Mycena vitilis]|nr:hypothetical protein C8R47DRAFT_1325203 [Mycena vitilis]
MLHAGLENLESPNDLQDATLCLADIASLRTKVHANATVQAWRGAITNPVPEKSNSLTYWIESTVEKEYYRPFRNLLNAICEAVDVASESERCQSPMLFSLCDQGMQDRVGNKSSTKPALLAYEHAIRVGRLVSWNEVEAAVTVKDNWRDLSAEAAIYGRALLTSRPSRHAAWIILLKHTTSEARVSFFQRQGLTRTSPFQLTTSAGFDAFVCSVIGLILDQSRANTRVELPVPGNQCSVHVAHNICYRAARKADINADSNGTLESPTYRRIIITTEGFPLRDAKGPRDLAEALLHAMIGYLKLLRRGWQHPNISNESVLLDNSFDVDECPLDEMSVQSLHRNAVGSTGSRDRFGLKPCRAILIDTGQAIEWKTGHEPAGQPVGTLPFMSFSLLQKWSQPEAHLHTGLDDLESFIWIFVWEVLHQGHKRRLLSPMDKQHLQGLMSTDPAVLALAKRGVLTAFEKDADMFDDSYLSPYIKLLNEWSVRSDSARPVMRRLMSGYRKRADGDEGGIADDLKEIEKLCFETGHKYLETGFKHLNELPGFWIPLEPAT